MCIWKEMQVSIEKVLMNQIHFMFLDLLSDRAHTHVVCELSSLQQLPAQIHLQLSFSVHFIKSLKSFKILILRQILCVEFLFS